MPINFGGDEGGGGGLESPIFGEYTFTCTPRLPRSANRGHRRRYIRRPKASGARTCLVPSSQAPSRGGRAGPLCGARVVACGGVFQIACRA